MSPLIEAFTHFECVRNAKMSGSIRVACMHDSQSDQKGYIDAEEFVDETAEKESIVVSQEQVAT